MATPTILKFGLGCDSSSILIEWIKNPSSRDFELKDLIVLSAQTGNESIIVKNQVEKHIYPLLQEHNIRTVQIARSGPLLSDGYSVLDDSRAPRTCFIEGAYTLSDELISNGTVPQYSARKRRCSNKSKGVVLDAWMNDEFGEQSVRSVVGFNADEQYRVERAEFYGQENCVAVYPLIEWGWNRAKTESYTAEFAGERFFRSACYFCPFSGIAGSPSEILTKYRMEPPEAGFAAFIEFVSLCMNPRQSLYTNGRTVRSLLQNDANTVALQNLEERLESTPWAVYNVRRIYGQLVPFRSVRRLYTGSRAAMRAKLASLSQEYGIPLVTEANIERLYLERRGENERDCEQMIVCSPAVVNDKERKSFEKRWTEAHQLTIKFC